MQVVVPYNKDHAERPVHSADVKLHTISQTKPDSVGNTNDNASLTSSPCHVNAAPADDKEKDPVSELKQQLKESVDHYIALQRNVLSLLHIIVPYMNSGNV